MNARRGRGARLEPAPGAVPITRSEAVDYLEGFIGTETARKYGGAVYSECEAIVDLVVACRRAYPPHAAESFVGDGVGVFAAIVDLWGLQPDERAVRALREKLASEDARCAELAEAAKHLRAAARLIGVREDLFYSIETPEHHASRVEQFRLAAYRTGAPGGWTDEHAERLPPVVMDDPPAIAGETGHENDARRVLNRVALHGSTDLGMAYMRSRLARYDRPGGSKASMNTLAVRRLWEPWPERLRGGVPSVWEPFAVVAEILRWLGYRIDSRAVRSTIAG